MNLLDQPRSAEFFNLNKIKNDYMRKCGNEEMMAKFILVELWMRKFDMRTAQ